MICVDLAGSDVSADLLILEGRASMVDAVAELTNGPIDAVIANAGSAAAAQLTVSINYFCAVATLKGLHLDGRLVSAARRGRQLDGVVPP